MVSFGIQDMAVFCKRKGFVYQSSEIYGGMSGFWDFGALGVELKNNIKQQIWQRFVQQREDVIGIDGSIITHPGVWKASGHIDSFTDAVLECSKCRNKLRADHFIEDKLKINVEGIKAEDVDIIVKKNKLKCPKCGSMFMSASTFNLMFKTNIGPVSNNASYLRPETAQVIFTDFKLVMENNRMKLPFGIAQLGKAFRNEISPRDFLFRSREFEQFEIEFFVHPDKINDCPFIGDVKRLKANVLTKEKQENGKSSHTEMTVKDMLDKKMLSQWHAYWLAMFYKFFQNLGIKKENLRLREHLKDELAHYAQACFDIEYHFPFGWKEIHGNADRTQFDLQQHMKVSKMDLSVFDEESRLHIVPYVASEPSQGIERAFLAFLFDAYFNDQKRGNVVLKLHPLLAPYKVAVFPLINKPELRVMAEDIFNNLKQQMPAYYDQSGSIGRRYARQDEIGTPYCITVDFDSIKDNSVTIRDRDTTKQVRIKITKLRETLSSLMIGHINFKGL